MLCDITIEFRRERVDCPVLFLKYFIIVFYHVIGIPNFTQYTLSAMMTFYIKRELLNMYILRAIQTRYVVTVDGCTKR